MDTPLETLFAALADSARDLVTLNQTFKRLGDAALAVGGEYHDVKEQLERLTAEVRQLRERLDQNGGARG